LRSRGRFMSCFDSATASRLFQPLQAVYYQQPLS